MKNIIRKIERTRKDFEKEQKTLKKEFATFIKQEKGEWTDVQECFKKINTLEENIAFCHTAVKALQQIHIL